MKCIEDEESSEAIEWIEHPQENIECLDDSEPGSLNNIEQGACAGRVHERLDVIIDSGASANALPVGWCNHVPTFPLGTEEKPTYRTANGGIVHAIGRKSIYGETITGHTVGLNFTEMEVNRPLASVSKMVRAGNIVVFGCPKGGNYVKNIATGLRHQLVEKNGIYLFLVWVKPGTGGPATHGNLHVATASETAGGASASSGGAPGFRRQAWWP